jgi:hypothetical protein
MDVEVPAHVSEKFQSFSPMTWFKKAADGDRNAQLQVGFVFGVFVVLFLILSTVTTNSGSAPQGTFPRLLVFNVDGVSVEEFRRAAALRRVPSMDFFASQSANCRPLSQDDFFRELDATAAAGHVFSSRYAECVTPNAVGRTGTAFSLLTGQSSLKPGGPEVTLSLLSETTRNFTTFFRRAREMGFTSAILGASPLLTVPSGGPVDDQNQVSTLCGILDTECVLQATVGQQVANSSVPRCTVPVNAQQPSASMLQPASSCNTRFQGYVGPTDTPAQIWERIKYVVAAESDIIYVQIPEDTVRYWMSLRPAVRDQTAQQQQGSVDAAFATDTQFALDAALYDIDGIFSKLLRTIAIKSMEDGEQWLTLLSVSSPKQSQILLASNVIASGLRRDVGNVYDMANMSPTLLFSIISDWLQKRTSN